MKEQVLIRSESRADVDAIAAVTVAAFQTLEIVPTPSSSFCASRAANALIFSLVAEVEGRWLGTSLSPL